MLGNQQEHVGEVVNAMGESALYVMVIITLLVSETCSALC